MKRYIPYLSILLLHVTFISSVKGSIDYLDDSEIYDTIGVINNYQKSVSVDPSSLTLNHNYFPGGNVFPTEQYTIAYGNKYQRTAVWQYTVYVNPGETTRLILPIEKAINDDGTTGISNISLEAQGYYRWYDYQTDSMSSNISAIDGSLLNNTNKGLIATNIDLMSGGAPAYNGSQVAVINYTAPTDTGFSDVIACDVSDYSDYVMESGYVTTEPTLSIRYIFNILPATTDAQNTKSILQSSKFPEEHYMYLGGNSAGTTTFNVRTDRSFPFEYKYYACAQTSPTSQITYFGSSPVPGKSIVWYVVSRKSNNVVYYRASSSCYSSYQAQYLVFTKAALSWNNASGQQQGIGFNEEFDIYAYVSDNTLSGSGSVNEGHQIPLWASLRNFTPIAHYTCVFTQNMESISDSQLSAGANGIYKKRTDSYIQTNYKMAATPITFDVSDGLSGLSANYDYPTSANNEITVPFNLDENYYAFVYPSIKNQKVLGGFEGKLTCSHGEHGYYKSANFTDNQGTPVSIGTPDFNWYVNSTLFDRTHAKDASKYGYFFYMDGAGESRPVCRIDLDDLEICKGSTLVLTAWVSNLTVGSELPYVIFNFYGIGDDGNLNPVCSATSGRVTNGNGVWSQQYSEINLKELGDYTSYVLTIDNGCTNTQGADYCVDDIYFYYTNAKLQASQTSLACDETSGANILIRGKYGLLIEELSNMHAFGNQNQNSTANIYYRFVSQNGKVITGSDFYGTGHDDYGVTTINKSFQSGNTQYVTDVDGQQFFVMANKKFNLTADGITNYYVAISLDGVDFSDPVSGSVCEMVSNGFVVNPQTIVFTDSNGVIKEIVGAPDGAGNVIKSINADAYNGSVELNCRFDWFLGSLEELNNTTNSQNQPADLSLALKHFRQYYPIATTLAAPSVGNKVYTTADYHLLQKYIGKLVLYSSSIANHPFTIGENNFVMFAISTSGTPTGLTVCANAAQVSINVRQTGVPTLELGFSGVDYPDGGANALRIGLLHIDSLHNNGELLLPVNGFANSDGNKYRDLTFGASALVTLTDSDDPTATPGATVASVSHISVTENGGDANQIRMAFSGVTPAFSPNEGYYYKVRFLFNEVVPSGSSSVKDGYCDLTFKVVPEYLTWSPAGSNDNWNLDSNWERSDMSTLYKDKGQNSDDYSNYQSPLEHKGFVPMEFTKVTVDAISPAPFLYHLPDIGSGYGIVDVTNTVNPSSQATEGIQYELQAIFDNNDIACRSFYGNCCLQVYFKPTSEMRNTHYLKYAKAWLDFELTPNRWYMLSTPLKGVVAGDMYLPYSGNPSAPGARQETEAFSDITFDSTLTVNNRSILPVYQRSWDKSGSDVIKPDGGSYDSYISSVAIWDHVFNDVGVSYYEENSGNVAFSIKAGNNLPSSTKVMFRLPKSDTSYRYYFGSDDSGSIDPTTIRDTISHQDYGRLVAATSSVTISPDDNSHDDNQYYPVGNPFMATISMNKFFDQNPQLLRKYWMIVESEQKMYTETTLLGTVAPLQSFFVKPVSGTKPTVSFSADMTIARTTSNSQIRTPSTRAGSEYPTVTITASRGDFRSSISIVEKAGSDNSFSDREDAEVLFDSNLSDAPNLYSVAGSQLVAVNTVPQIVNIPLGFISTGNDPASVSFDGVESFGRRLYLLDTAQGNNYDLSETTELAIEANSHGRYFIVADNIEGGMEADLNIYSPERGMVVVSSGNNSPIRNIRVHSITGSLVRELVVDGEITTLVRLTSGCYVFTVTTDHKVYNRKVIVK